MRRPERQAVKVRPRHRSRSPMCSRSSPKSWRSWSKERPYETYVKDWRYVYPAVDQHGQVIDIFVSNVRDIAAAERFFTAP